VNYYSCLFDEFDECRKNGRRGVKMSNLPVKILATLLMEFAFLGTLHAHGDHSVPCSGPHKNDPECLVSLAIAPAISVNSATVDWLNEKIIVRGENFSAGTTITIAGLPATIDSQTADQIDIPFDAAIAGTPKGNHNLVATDGPSSSTSSISLFVKAEIIDQALGGCPCETDWSTELGTLWAPLTKTTDCYEITGGAGNPEDIAGTVLTDPADPSVYPHYPIGAAFTAEPGESVCQLTQVSNPLDPVAVTDLVKTRINRQQQGACRTSLVTNICSSITTVP
jgi:hypothetical protein